MWDKQFDDYIKNKGVIQTPEDRHKKEMVEYISQKYNNAVNLYRNSLLHPESSLGAKIPSDISQDSATACIKYNFTVTPNASGNFLVVLDPFIQPLQINTNAALNGIGGGTGLFTASDCIQDSSIIDMWRLVSTSIVVQYTGQLQALSGYLVGASTSNISNATFDTYCTFTNIEDIQNKRVSSPIEGMKLIYYPSDSTQLDYYKNTDYSTSPYNSNTRWKTNMVIAGAGLPSTACIRIDIYRNIEYISKPSVREYILHSDACIGQVDPVTIKDVRDNAVQTMADSKNGRPNFN